MKNKNDQVKVKKKNAPPKQTKGKIKEIRWKKIKRHNDKDHKSLRP
jgi:hypothetical protein